MVRNNTWPSGGDKMGFQMYPKYHKVNLSFLAISNWEILQTPKWDSSLSAPHPSPLPLLITQLVMLSHLINLAGVKYTPQLTYGI